MRLQNIRAAEIAERIFYAYRIFATRKYRRTHPHFSCGLSLWFSLCEAIIFHGGEDGVANRRHHRFDPSHDRSRLHFSAHLFSFLFFFRASFLFFTSSTSRTALPQQLDFLHAARDSLPHLTTRRLIAHVARLFP